jgi:glycosyltransferase A (GT-A) superfamily protein (DUF2064 family)
VLVMAKAPVTGRVKTRLGAVIGMDAAARVAAAALLDTLATCRAVFSECHLALDGDLRGVHREPEIREHLDDWVVHPQRGTTLGERLAHAHSVVAGHGPTVQVGMDTPQMSGPDLERIAVASRPGTAVLGPAPDGGWWVLGVQHPSAAAGLAAVRMSTSQTFARTRETLEAAGQSVVTARSLRDVDTVEDADAVAASMSGGHFRAAWLTVPR